MVDLTKIFARRAVDRARAGEKAYLIEYLENPHLRVGEIRAVLAQILKGELKASKGGVAGRYASFVPVRCLIPAFDGALFSHEWREALWARFFTAAPARRRRSVVRYTIVKRA